jgi:hypothetical protein
MLIGRRLVKNWGNGVVVAIEELKPTAPLEEGLYDVLQIGDDLVYRPVGQPHSSCDGHAVGEIFETPGAWVTTDELQNCDTVDISAIENS